MIKVVVDGYGGDNAPQEIVQGCLLALDKHTDLGIVITGKQHELSRLIHEKYADRIEIVDAQQVITNNDVPTTAIATKKDSSLVKALERVRQDDQCVGVLSAGSTGAVLAGGIFKVGRIKGVSRPALAPLLPTITDSSVILCDCGANVDCQPQMLVQFASMASAYARAVLNVANPRVGLLSNGTEDKKGNDLNRQAFTLLKEESNINFVGNIEAREILSGDYDVVVCDGFNGNIALKSIEGTALMVLKTIKKEITKGFNKVGALLLKKAFSRVRAKLDYNKVGGALFIGLDKILIKAHGSSKCTTIEGAIEQIITMHNNKLIDRIKEGLPINAND
ncbi:MAG: phosphate acyltransferase PlsX [Clostridia bacterium]|nr:phosphate acyltransferase PlsX [Clostridia bacterium]